LERMSAPGMAAQNASASQRPMQDQGMYVC
jgi:hypothetical protein